MPTFEMDNFLKNLESNVGNFLEQVDDIFQLFVDQVRKDAVEVILSALCLLNNPKSLEWALFGHFWGRSTTAGVGCGRRGRGTSGSGRGKSEWGGDDGGCNSLFGPNGEFQWSY